MLWLFYHDLVALTFNEELARVSGIKIRFLNSLLAILTALTVVLAMRLVGIMLISALLILPASTALQVARGFKMTVLFSILSATLAIISGIVISFVLNIPSGATIILSSLTLFGISAVVKNTKKQAVTR